MRSDLFDDALVVSDAADGRPVAMRSSSGAVVFQARAGYRCEAQRAEDAPVRD